jgi:hypothetical protein
MIRDGMAYVGVDAQAGGINGEPDSIASEDAVDGLKPSDPARYGSLRHPGDSFSYSIYAQAGEAIRVSGSRLLGGLKPKRVMALGESQSAFRLVTYIDAIQPLAPGIYDAYFVYSRGGDASRPVASSATHHRHVTMYGPDIYTEPDGDPDTWRISGRCARWPASGRGTKGSDQHPVVEGPKRTPSSSTTSCSPSTARPTAPALLRPALPHPHHQAG